MLKVLQSVVGKPDHLSLLKTGEEMNDAKNKDNYEFYLEILQTLIHDLWILKHGANEKTLVNIDLLTQLKRLSETSENKRLAVWLKEIESLRETLAVNVNRKIATDALFVQMAKP